MYTLQNNYIFTFPFFGLAVNACPITFFINKMEDSYSCKTTAVANYLNEVLRLSPIPNSTRLSDGECTAEISRHYLNDGLEFQIETCIAVFEDITYAYCKSKESTSEVLIRTTCWVSWIEKKVFNWRPGDETYICTMQMFVIARFNLKPVSPQVDPKRGLGMRWFT